MGEAKPESGRVSKEVSTSVNTIKRGDIEGPVPGVATEDMQAR